MRHFNLHLLLAASAPINAIKIIKYEELRELHSQDLSYNSYGSLDKLKTLDLEISDIDKRYQQNWAYQTISKHDAIKTKLLEVESTTETIIVEARCDKSSRDVLCEQLWERQQWLHSTALRTSERILYLQHKETTDGYAETLETAPFRGIGHELALAVVLIPLFLFLDIVMRQRGWGRRAGD